MTLRDSYSRIIDYLRISITDRCNLQCVYCMPCGAIKPIIYKDILTYEEIISIVRISSAMGVRKIRITGGEPLARKNVQHLIRAISEIKEIEDLSLTTNGVLLEKYAEQIAAAGLERINVSLDSLRPERYSEITGGGDLDTVLRGIERAHACGLDPLKINMVPIRGVNDDEILDFAQLTVRTPYHVRFIEFMPLGNRELYDNKQHIPSEEIQNNVGKLGGLTPVRIRKSGPARYFKLPGAKGVIGFISAMTHHFCGDCNRLRLTADGKIRPCLFSETEIDLKPALRNNVSYGEIERLLKLAIEVKPEGRHILSKAGGHRPMPAIGG